MLQMSLELLSKSLINSKVIMLLRTLACYACAVSSLYAAVDWKPVFDDKPVTAAESAAIDAALPNAPIAAVQESRRILILSSTAAFRHSSIPVGKEALTKLGKATGAFETVVSDDPANFEPECAIIVVSRK